MYEKIVREQINTENIIKIAVICVTVIITFIIFCHIVFSVLDIFFILAMLCFDFALVVLYYSNRRLTPIVQDWYYKVFDYYGTRRFTDETLKLLAIVRKFISREVKIVFPIWVISFGFFTLSMVLYSIMLAISMLILFSPLFIFAYIKFRKEVLKPKAMEVINTILDGK